MTGRGGFTLESKPLFQCKLPIRDNLNVETMAYLAAFFLGVLIVRRLSQLGYCDIPAHKVSDGQFVSFFLVLIGLGFLLSAWLRPAFPLGRKRK